MNILIIGAGNMGVSFGGSFVTGKIILPHQLYFMERLVEKQVQVDRLSDHPIIVEPSPLLAEMNLIVLCVKPQDFPSLAQQIYPFLQSEQLILSIMAGIQIPYIQESLRISKVIRAMPNLPSQVGEGMTVFTSSPEVNINEILSVQNLLNTTGKTLYTEKEHLLNAATAVSGSGPAFVYYFMESMMQAAQKMGFTNSEAQLLVHQTFKGSIDLLQKNNLNCSEWIQKVSSKGGTTEASIRFFSSQRLNEYIEDGLEVARKRAEELSASSN